uniref:Flavodoxin-like domain-containing protein n=1 Tax=Megaselia scalaris TaxID=36166 RepID=T1GJT3_MEGSC
MGRSLLLISKSPSPYIHVTHGPTTVTTTVSSDNSFIKKLKASGRSLVVFYGSQTGTAEEFAGRLAKEGIRYQMKGMVADPEECDMEELLQLKNIEKSLAVFCLATYGEGDPTDNAMEFYEWITNGDVDMSGLNYAVSIFKNLLKKAIKTSHVQCEEP